jgi:hypothetical protein
MFNEGDLVWWERMGINKGTFIRPATSSDDKAVVVSLPDGYIRVIEVAKLNPVSTIPVRSWVGD